MAKRIGKVKKSELEQALVLHRKSMKARAYVHASTDCRAKRIYAQAKDQARAAADFPWDDPERWESWLMKKVDAATAAVNAPRWVAGRAVLFDDDEVPSATADPERMYLAVELLEDLDAAMRILPQEEYQAVRLLIAKPEQLDELTPEMMSNPMDAARESLVHAMRGFAMIRDFLSKRGAEDVLALVSL